jgi:hypothetical protein
LIDLNVESLRSVFWDHISQMRDARLANTIFVEIADRDTSRHHYETLCWNTFFLAQQATYFHSHLLNQLESLKSDLRDLMHLMEQIQSESADQAPWMHSSLEVRTYAEPLTFTFNAVLASIVSETDALAQLVSKYLKPEVASKLDTIPRVVSCLNEHYPRHQLTTTLLEAGTIWMKDAREYRNTVIHRYQLLGIGEVQAIVAIRGARKTTQVRDTFMIPRHPTPQYRIWYENGENPPRWHITDEVQFEVSDWSDQAVLERITQKLERRSRRTEEPEMIPIQELSREYISGMVSTTTQVIDILSELEFNYL